jgi:nucleoid-associated protein YgaU
VWVLWGRLSFYGRLTSFDIEYTLFRPSGAPLRAKANLSFQGYKNPQEATLEANMSSPDLSHLVVVTEGDTLPLLCHRIYGDSRYYVEVARFNGLPTFRALKPGLTLHFPPLG